MTQKISIKIIENGITRDATPKEIRAWCMKEFYDACYRTDNNCEGCFNRIRHYDDVYGCGLSSFKCTVYYKILQNKEIILQLVEE